MALVLWQINILRVINEAWTARIPDSWRVSVIVPVPKKGDLRKPGNYRGICLINTLLKVLCKIVERRMRLFAEENNLLCREQAGFRTREECVAQVATLLEIKRRR